MGSGGGRGGLPTWLTLVVALPLLPAAGGLPSWLALVGTSVPASWRGDLPTWLVSVASQLPFSFVWPLCACSCRFVATSAVWCMRAVLALVHSCCAEPKPCLRACVLAGVVYVRPRVGAMLVWPLLACVLAGGLWFCAWRVLPGVRLALAVWLLCACSC